MDMKYAKTLFVVFLVGMLALASCSVNYSQEELDEQVNQAEAAKDSEKAILQEQYNVLAEDKKLLEDANEELESQVEELEAEPEEEPVEVEPASYLLEDVTLTGNFKDVIDNDNLETLAYGDISYEGEDYDFEELLIFGEDFRPVLNVEDFGSDVAIEVDSEAFSYELSFDEPILLVDGEDLVLNFLGRVLTIVESGDNEITYRTSQQAGLSLNEELLYHDNTITVVGFDDGDENSVLLMVNGELKSFKEGDTKRINGIQISVEDIFISSIGDYTSVVLYVGEDIVETVNDREEFEDDDRYDWIVKSNEDGISTIGVKLIEEYTEEDEVLALGDSLSLPYDYKTVLFDSLRNLDVSDVRVSVRTDEIRVESDSKIEIAGKKIDDNEFSVSDEGVVSYEYKGNDRETSDFNDIVLFFGDREISFKIKSNDDIRFYDAMVSYVFGYNFGVKEIVSAPSDMNEDEDFRLDNGDILYQSDANDEDEEETSVTIGFVDTEEDQEVILKVM